MNTTHTSSSLVCIRKETGDVVGAGFLVDEQHILTCAHVVAEALEWSGGESSPEPPQELIHFDFPLLDHSTMLTAQVVFWQSARADWNGGDISGLQLLTDAPIGAEAARFALAEDVWDHDFRAFGFPSGQDNGVWATGRLLDRQASNWIQIEDNKTGGFAVMPGFSGGAVWDEQLGGVVGMVVASIVQPGTKGAFVIPLDVLLAAWPLIKPTTRQRVFLSAAPEAAIHLARLRTDLEANDILVWDEQHGPAGRSAPPERVRQQGIRAAQALVVIVTSQTLSSRIVREHLHLAELYQRPSIFVWMGDEERSTEQVGWHDIIWVDAHGPNYMMGLQEIGAALRKRASITGLLDILNEPEWEPRNPYVGLRAFTAEETKDFFGRELFIDQLYSDLQQLLNTEPHTKEAKRLLTIIGASGSGKSSVVLAGLLPRLRQSDDSKSWVYLNPMTPSKDPIEALVDTLSPHFPDTSFKTQRENLEDDTTNGLHRLAKHLAAEQERITHQKTRVVLFVDQFEELFTQTASEGLRRRFLDLLCTAVIEPEGPLLMLLTLRADFYHRLIEYPEFYRLIEPTLHILFPLEIEELRAAIERPAAQPDVQLIFEGNLVGDLLFEVQGQAGALPLLQFTLQQLFARRIGHRLTRQAYIDIGKVSGALAKYGDETYEQLPKEQQQLARVLFLRLLEPGSSEHDTTRRRAALTEFVFDDQKQTRLMQETIDIFVKARLLTTNTNESTGTNTIEVSHEALIREWPLLVSWLREARDDIHLQHTVSEDAAEWERHKRPGDRLYRGAQLKEAQAWARRNATSKQEQAFLHTSAARSLRSLIAIIAVMLVVVTSCGIAGWFALHQPPKPGYVTTADEYAIGSLRWAIGTAHAGDTITFDPSMVGQTIVLKNADIHIFQQHLTIQSPATDRITIREIGVSLIVDKPASVTISGLVFQGSNTENQGSLIYNSGKLTLKNCAISGNTIHGFSIGGAGIANYGDGTITMSNSTVSDNTLSFSNGVSDSGGAGIYNGGGTFIMSNSTISHNTTSVHGTADGGGIANGGTFIMSNSTVSNNTDSYGKGGGIYNFATIAMTNSTVSDNTAQGFGGGIYNYNYLYGGNTTLIFCTIVNNSVLGPDGSDIANRADKGIRSQVYMKASIVGGNDVQHTPTAGVMTSGGYNVIQYLSSVEFGSKSNTDRSVDKLTSVFGPSPELQNNGGSTQTYRLVAGTDDPAEGAIPQDECSDSQGHPILTDQRGLPRPGKNKQSCDSGAYESQG
jgi:Trypsin-like peptidase domain